MVRESSRCKFRPSITSGAVRIICYVEDCLNQQRFVPQASFFSELLLGKDKYRLEILFGKLRKSISRHDSVDFLFRFPRTPPADFRNRILYSVVTGKRQSASLIQFRESFGGQLFEN